MRRLSQGSLLAGHSYSIAVAVCGQRRASFGALIAIYSLSTLELDQTTVKVRVRFPPLRTTLATSLFEPCFHEVDECQTSGI